MKHEIMFNDITHNYLILFIQRINGIVKCLIGIQKMCQDYRTYEGFMKIRISFKI